VPAATRDASATLPSAGTTPMTVARPPANASPPAVATNAPAEARSAVTTPSLAANPKHAFVLPSAVTVAANAVPLSAKIAPRPAASQNVNAVPSAAARNASAAPRPALFCCVHHSSHNRSNFKPMGMPFLTPMRKITVGNVLCSCLVAHPCGRNHEHCAPSNLRAVIQGSSIEHGSIGTCNAHLLRPTRERNERRL